MIQQTSKPGRWDLTFLSDLPSGGALLMVKKRIMEHGLMSKPRSFKSSQSVRSFTLIELLVTIAIIGILAALLMSALGSAKNKASEVSDLSNLKQQMIATQLYASDNHDVLPCPNWDGGQSDRPGWLYTADLTLLPPAEFKVETGLFWKILHNPKLYFCPMDRTNSSLFLQRPQQISSYAMNGAVVGYPPPGVFTVTPVKSSAMRPTDCAFWETDETRPAYFNDGANYPDEGVSGRHREGGIQATFGGTVDYIKTNVWHMDVVDTNRNRLWCYPGTPDGRAP
jgi:prepilin-type N-terminal cleavage/methylation domain-containing protein